tara:strand:- start:608 stop:976 length:369 start_codon:yes stop_codon:yes gene_type:complete
MASVSEVEEQMLVQIRNSGLPEPIREHKFHPTRRWRLDFFWLCPISGYDLALEVEGGTWMARSRHTSGKGFENDIEKYNEALMHNVLVLRATTKHVKDGRAIEWVKGIMDRWEMVSPRHTRQ